MSFGKLLPQIGRQCFDAQEKVSERGENSGGYCIQREQIVREGEKFYVILTVRGGQSQPYTPAELWVGRQTQGEDNPHRLDYLRDQLRRRERALAGMRQSASLQPEDLAREEALLVELSNLEKEWSAWQR